MKRTDAMNTYNPALGIIIERGYVLSVIDNEESFDWKATKGDDEFIASDPLRLLGLLMIFEAKGAQWNDTISNRYDEMLKQFYKE